MRTNTSFIEINGKRYDAITGQLIGAVKQARNHLKETAKGRVIDGLVSKRHPLRPAHSVHRRAQRSKTLMRKIVPHQAHTKSAEHQQVDKQQDDRLTSAKSVPRNRHIRHFGHQGASSVASHSEHATRTAHHKALLSGEVINHRSMPGAAAVAVHPLPSMSASVSHQNLERMLDSALLRADAHKQALKGRRGRKHHFGPLGWLSIALVIIGILAAATYAAWQYIPHTSMKLASIRAGISGSMPDYIPSGFKPDGPVAYENGSVKISYKANDGRSFVISQQATNWDSSSLQANIVPDGSKVQTSQVRGSTVYIYDVKNHATWVNNGVRYTVQDNAKLSSDQLLKIAESL